MFSLTNTPIDTKLLKSELISDKAGAFASFEGLVRNHNDGKSVASLEYEAHLPLCANEIKNIYKEVEDKFNLLGFNCVHRIGHLPIGDMAVWVGVVAAHRDDAFKACRYIIDEVKKRLPIWKKEHYTSGASEWINCTDEAQKKLIKESDYYVRQMNLKEIGLAGQEQLKQARVLVVGAGGLGSSVLLGLAGAGVGTIGICEFDKLDATNLHRQSLYSSDDIGKPKIDLAENRIKALNPFINVVKHGVALSVDNTEDIIRDYDYVCDCTDNFKTKFLLNDVCFFLNKTLIQASIYQYEGQLTVFSPDMPGCVRCLWPEVPEPGCVGTCIEAGVLGVVPSVLGSLQATETIKLICNFAETAVGKTVILNLLNYSVRIIPNAVNTKCPLCSNNPSINSLSGGNTMSDDEPTIDQSELKQFDLDQCVFLDIREEPEVQADSVTQLPIEYLPLSKFQESEFDFEKDKQYIIFCAKGVRSLGFVEHLHEQGITNTLSLNDGIDALHQFCRTNETENV